MPIPAERVKSDSKKRGKEKKKKKGMANV